MSDMQVLSAGVEELAVVLWQRRRGGRDHFLRSIYFEYPGNSGFMNTGDHDLVIESISVTWVLSGLTPHHVELPINQLIKPGEIKLVLLPSLYQEPAGIGSAEWVYGDTPEPLLLRDAFEIGRPGRCSVFHVYNVDRAVFRLINELGARQHLATVRAQATLNVFHVHSGGLTREPLDVLTAFLAIDGCRKQTGDKGTG
jgi:hypothetical protein